MYKTILVPIDLSHAEVGQKTLQIARQIGGSEARIFLLHVLPELPSLIASQIPKEMLDRTMRKAEAELKDLGADAGAQTKVSHGHTSTVILEHAEAVGADLIIIASHRPGLQDYFLGSTAERVVRHAQCAVLIHR